MTNTQLYLAIALPILVFILGFIWSARNNHAEIAVVRAEMNVIRAEMNVLRAEMNGKFDVIAIQLAAINRTLEVLQQDMRHFDQVNAGLDKRVQVLENRA